MSKTQLRTTMFYQAPEVSNKNEPFICSASDTFSLGIIFCEVEETSKRDTANKLTHTVPLTNFTRLTRDMIQQDFRLRPTMPSVLERLGESMELTCINGLACENVIANAFEDKMDIISTTSYDKSLGLHRLLTLLRSDKSDDIENAYWLLQTLAVKEASNPGFPAQSVLSILPHFHTRLHVNDNDSGRSTFNKLMYCRALEALCNRPYFLLSDDMKLNLRAFSVIPACERSVLMVMAKTTETFPAILEWCGHGKWGKHGDKFNVFVKRFANDWRLDVAVVSCQLLGLPSPTVDTTSATTHLVLEYDAASCTYFFTSSELSDQHGLKVSM